ncbi:hypothetical protein LF599_11230 [Pseudodesulfovibrio thermohalotolerans]|uniref:hypothetical protein n=1 Tax=Pseudodesulfovibrio thermohalotolerans TaxID=2880651 RepID=UPI0024427FF8|nr:hypothetical protein [Pseudodesulfovibrio thermohalotolerans]WFS61246.1 hypothetical protein LF599_11230 [Pseudodesulfovibrio thermohalotolerans]
MFRKIIFLAMSSYFVLFLFGCSGFSSVDGGISPVETIVLDDEYGAAVNVEKNDVFALDVSRPSSKGYRISGAAFDPEMLRMERYFEYDDDSGPRARYLFSALEEGATDVLIRMTPEAGGETVVYRQVAVSIGSGNAWLD